MAEALWSCLKPAALPPRPPPRFPFTRIAALYVALGYKAGYMRLIKDTDGSNHDYGTGYSWTDDIYSHVDFSFGLTFFLPKGARGAETHKASYDDLLDSGLGAK